MVRSFRRCRGAVVALLAVSVLSGCGSREEVGADTELTVAVSLLPQRYFVERLGGERVSVLVMVGPGASPETYEPKPSQMAMLSNAAVYFAMGVPFEHAWMERLGSSLGGAEVVDVTAGVERLPMDAHHHHAEGSAHDHGDRGLEDPHTWLDPARVREQCRVMCDVLSRLDPSGADTYRTNLDVLLAEVDALDAEIRERLAPHAGRAFMVFHPSWGYFANAYGLRQVSIEVGGQEPSASELARCIERARAEDIRVVFAQPESSMVPVGTVANAIGASVVVISPLEENWFVGMRAMASALDEAFSR